MSKDRIVLLIILLTFGLGLGGLPMVLVALGVPVRWGPPNGIGSIIGPEANRHIIIGGCVWCVIVMAVAVWFGLGKSPPSDWRGGGGNP